ncbi:MAG TPA: hypothetical protein VFO77_16175 [Actinoplanes sp.]|nr:hypothetical protein [Actinoplanes sp.]
MNEPGHAAAGAAAFQSAGPVGDVGQDGSTTVTTGVSPRLRRTSMVIASALVVVVGLILAVVVLRDLYDAHIAASRPPDRSHDVDFLVEVTGHHNPGSMSYINSRGTVQEDVIPADKYTFGPRVHFSGSRYLYLHLSAQAPPGWLEMESPFGSKVSLPGEAPRVSCSIVVDGVLSARSAGRGRCQTGFALNDVGGVAITRRPATSP